MAVEASNYGKGRVFIDAMNIHTGGGATLLDGLLMAKTNFADLTLVVDSRYVPNTPLPKEIEVRRVVPSLIGRLEGARWLVRNVKRGDRLICLGNLPPLLYVNGTVVLYIQNRYLIDSVPIRGFSFGVTTRLYLERFWLQWRSGCVSRFVVQTISMRRLLEGSGLAKGRPIDILPFAGVSAPALLNNSAATRSGFIYVASGEPHKNHLILLNAWRLLAKDGIFPQLRLTLDAGSFPELLSEIFEISRVHHLDIVNLGKLPRNEVYQEYTRAAALVYPSTFESFGLPLVEASHYGLPIIAPELDYVRDVVVPAETFDPKSSLSLVRAIKRFMGEGEQPERSLEPDEFVGQLLCLDDTALGGL